MIEYGKVIYRSSDIYLWRDDAKTVSGFEVRIYEKTPVVMRFGRGL